MMIHGRIQATAVPPALHIQPEIRSAPGEVPLDTSVPPTTHAAWTGLGKIRVFNLRFLLFWGKKKIGKEAQRHIKYFFFSK